MENTEEKTLKQLKEEAITLGVPQEDIDAFTFKAPLIATINALKAKNAKVETIEEKLDPRESMEVEKHWRSKAEIMRNKLDKQPKIRILLPLDPNQKTGVVREVMVKGRKELVHVSGAIETVQLNGYKTIIPKGKYFDVPQQVADLLAASYRQTQDAGHDYLIDRDNKVKENLQ